MLTGQKKDIIDALKKRPKKGLSDREMADLLYINRPSARMAELRKDGYVFASKVCKSVNKNGRKITFLRYTLVKEPEA